MAKDGTVTTTLSSSHHCHHARQSLRIRMIRHAESGNNQVYRTARALYRGGSRDFDEVGWNQYVDTHREADPTLSDVGFHQAQKLAQFLVPTGNMSSSPIAASPQPSPMPSPMRIITSPMRRALETIRPTMDALRQFSSLSSSSHSTPTQTQVIVHGDYFESEGCHLKERAEEGMNPHQITELLLKGNHHNHDNHNHNHDSSNHNNNDHISIECVGFPHPDRGWYVQGQSSETRQEAEARAARFYLWLMELLDQEVMIMNGIGDSDGDCDPVCRNKRKLTLLVGHGDFMSLVLKRMIAGFGHAIEQPGLPHRSAYVHYNTGLTDLEYFGHGRWLLMRHNATPHLCRWAPPAPVPLDETEYCDELLTGGSLKDGWSYLVPNTETFHLEAKIVSVAFEFCDDSELEDHVKEQTIALKALYMSSRKKSDNDALLLQEAVNNYNDSNSSHHPDDRVEVTHFIVKRGMQVVGVATYSDPTGHVTEVAVRPSIGMQVSTVLFDAVKNYQYSRKKMGRSSSGSLHVFPCCQESKSLFEELGFAESVNESANEDCIRMSMALAIEDSVSEFDRNNYNV